MDGQPCLDLETTQQIIPSPSTSPSWPLPITPSFCPRGQSVSKAYLVPRRKMLTPALQTRPSSELAVPGCGTLRPHTQGGGLSPEVAEDPTKALSLSTSSRSLPAYTPYSQPYKHTQGLQPATLNTFCLSRLFLEAKT